MIRAETIGAASACRAPALIRLLLRGVVLCSFLAGCAGPQATGRAGSSPDAVVPAAPAGPRIVAAFGDWDVYARNYQISMVPAGKLTHLLYCFGKITPDGKVVLGDQWADVQKPYPGDPVDPGALQGSFHQLQILKHKFPRLRAILSIGGWNGSQKFSDVAAASATRHRFALSCLTVFLKTWPGVFDGIDLDWEYPVEGGRSGNAHRPADGQNYTLLIEEFRRQLDAQGKADGRRYLLTVSTPAGPTFYRHLELGRMAKSVDWFNLMAYDFQNASDPLTNFNAALFPVPGDPSGSGSGDSVDSAVRAYLAAGVPAAKIVVGVPCYGYGFAGTRNRNHGLYQPHSAASPPGTWAPGSFDYKDLKSHYLPTFTRFWQPAAKAPWLYNPAKGLWFSYEDPESAGAKAAYVRSHGLGGVMLWELSQDDGSLLNAVYRQLGPH